MKYILVVDDELDVQALFQQRFRKEIRSGELHFEFAHNVTDAMKYLEQHVRDIMLILSDINMPGKSGLDLLAEVKEKYLHPPPVVMMITAYGDENNFSKAKQL
ncbi:MAG TPA: response regulator, partial [Phnomibacter sp.]|nr:response regulator [Phnomibacter sp.]